MTEIIKPKGKLRLEQDSHELVLKLKEEIKKINNYHFLKFDHDLLEYLIKLANELKNNKNINLLDVIFKAISETINYPSEEHAILKRNIEQVISKGVPPVKIRKRAVHFVSNILKKVL